MTRKRFNKLMTAMAHRVYAQNGKTAPGDVQRFYKDFRIENMPAYKRGETKSYAEAWAALKPCREAVGM